MEANTILNEDNYFVWEFNTRMKLAKNGLLEHLFTTESPGKATFLRPPGKSTT